MNLDFAKFPLVLHQIEQVSQESRRRRTQETKTPQKGATRPPKQRGRSGETAVLQADSTTALGSCRLQALGARLGALGPLPDSGKGDLPCEASFSDPESEAKRRIVFTISAGASSAKQSPSSKHSPLPSGARGDGGQGHGPDSRKRGRRKRASAGTPSLSSSVSPKRRALPSVAGLFTQSSGSPLNLNSMVRREQRAGAGWLMRAHARPAGTHACARPLGQQHQPAPWRSQQSHPLRAP